MANLGDTAKIIEDLYYQNYKTDEDFFHFNHFLYLCGVSYSRLLEDEYKAARKEARSEEGYSDVYLQDDWLVEQPLDMKRDPDEAGSYFAVLPKPVISFPYDPFSFGIQSVRPVGATRCRQFVRASLQDAWMDCQLPRTGNAFFFASAGKLYITNAFCPVEKVIVQMVPDISDESFGEGGGPVPKSKEEPIIRATLDLMLRAREGTVVDMSNNSNPNKVMQTEVDTAFSNLKTKP